MESKPSPKLNMNDAVQIWLKHWAGQYQHDIAAHYGVNQGRISEIINEQKFLGSKAIARRLKYS
jgi:plasmid maintenance system antidote protein VapI